MKVIEITGMIIMAMVIVVIIMVIYDHKESFKEYSYKDSAIFVDTDIIDSSDTADTIDICAEHCKNDPLCDGMLYNTDNKKCEKIALAVVPGDTILGDDSYIPGKTSRIFNYENSAQSFKVGSRVECNQLRKSYGLSDTIAYYDSGICTIASLHKKSPGNNSVFILKDQ